MKVVILAGGFGTRFSEYTEIMPKPMIRIGDMPIIHHIMRWYSYFGYTEFILALGYKHEIFKEYFLNYSRLHSDFRVNMKSGDCTIYNKTEYDWNISLIDTGINTMTGGRIKKLQKIIGNETFLLTYGDGLADVDINKSLDFHKKNGKKMTVTAVRPNARFGELEISDNNIINKFEEKPQLHEGWINGGYFIIEPEFIDLIDGDENMLEREPMNRACEQKELIAYKHYGFWQCMDNKRDYDYLENEYNNNPKWIK